MLVNLTPHPIHIYRPDGICTIPPSGQVARIGQIDLGTQTLPACEFPVEYVEYRHVNGLPERREGTWYIVSLALALASDRPDLLVPYDEVRSDEGTVIGCRMLARPL